MEETEKRIKSKVKRREGKHVGKGMNGSNTRISLEGLEIPPSIK